MNAGMPGKEAEVLVVAVAESGRSRRRLVLVAASLSAMLVTGVLLVVPSVLTPRVSDADVDGRLRSCLLVEADTSVFIGEGELTACLAAGLMFADRVGRLGVGVATLSAMVADEPRLHDACHLASHRSGREIASTGDVPGLLAAHPEMLCSWGLGHGLLEGFASVPRSQDDWVTLAAACDRFATLPGDLSAPLSLCADGFGHALWDASKDFWRSLSGCLLLSSDAAVSGCAGGVVMQRFRPADSAAERFGAVAESPGEGSVAEPGTGVAFASAAEVVDACGMLEEFPLPVVMGCASGGGYVLAVSLLSDQVALSFSKVSGAPVDASLRAGLVTKVQGIVGEVWAVCDRLSSVATGGAGVSLVVLCFDAMGPYLPAVWGDGSPVVERAEFCAGVPVERRSLCVSR